MSDYLPTTLEPESRKLFAESATQHLQHLRDSEETRQALVNHLAWELYSPLINPKVCTTLGIIADDVLRDNPPAGGQSK